MKITEQKGAVVLHNADCFSPRNIFENGQAFRFSKIDKDTYEGVVHGRYLRIAQSGESVSLYPCTAEEFDAIWYRYFDFETDYAALFQCTEDERLRTAIRHGAGLRVLNQPPFETLISFILSANNNVGRICGIVQRLCETCGRPFSFEGKTYYAFPTPEALAGMAEGSLRSCGCGYRAPYVTHTAKMIADGFPLLELCKMDYWEAKQKLCSLPGVGPKVADCVLLFSLGKRDAFPADVWIKRVLKNDYGFLGTDREIYSFARKKFGPFSGIAQQYLFYYARESRMDDVMV
ncbi:MAG: DNA-3-methyladenine glycosylase family protein [Christensenellaceae bacterium]